MKVQYCYLTDLDQINEQKYFLVLPDFSFSKRIDTEAAQLLHAIDKAEQVKEDIDNIDFIKQSVVQLKAEYNKIVTSPRYLMEKGVFNHMMAEVGDAFYLFNGEIEMIEFLEKGWKKIFDVEIKDMFPLKKIYLMSEETGKPIGEFNYKIHKDMV